MPRKKTETVSGSSIKFAAILAFFRTQPMEIVKFSQELVNDAVRERENKGKAVLAGRAASKGAGTVSDATEKVDQATRSAIGNGAAGAGAVKEKRKPGPAKGTKRKAKDGDAAAGSAIGTTGAGATDEVTSADALPPQEGTLDLDAPAQ